jgi:hypothetical protein
MKPVKLYTKRRDNSTGCPVLDKIGVYSGNPKMGTEVCLHCFEPECYLDKEDKDVQAPLVY